MVRKILSLSQNSSSHHQIAAHRSIARLAHNHLVSSRLLHASIHGGSSISVHGGSSPNLPLGGVALKAIHATGEIIDLAGRAVPITRTNIAESSSSSSSSSEPPPVESPPVESSPATHVLVHSRPALRFGGVALKAIDATGEIVHLAGLAVPISRANISKAAASTVGGIGSLPVGTLGLVAVGEAAVLPALARALLPVEADTTATSKVWVSTSTSHAAIVHITTILAVGETASVPTVALALLPVVANATAAGLLTEPSVEATIEASTVVVPTPISLRAVTADVAGLAAGVTGQCRLL